MAYELDTPYIRVFDATQSPAYLEMLAARLGVRRDPPADGQRLVYLDLGCAQGHTILALSPLYPNIDFIGIDINPYHITEGEDDARRFGLTNCRFLVADFRTLPSDLPQADYIVVHGTYSWLAHDVKTALEQACGKLAKPGGLLKLHYIVKPGALFRESTMGMIQGVLGEACTPEDGRQLLDLLAHEAEPLSRCFSGASKALEEMVEQTDKVWWHDFFNDDYQTEHAHAIIGRLKHQGFHFLGASCHERNLLQIQVSEAIVRRMVTCLDPGAAQTLFDMATANGSRDDIYVRKPFSPRRRGFHSGLRFGIIVPSTTLTDPYQTVRGQVQFMRQDCQEILGILKHQPQTLAELQNKLPSIDEQTIELWLDLLIAARKVGPFLSSAAAALIDNKKIQRINVERIGLTVRNINHKSSMPLLAVEYGNCLVAGWFEILVLHHFSDRHNATTQVRMLRTIHESGILFSGDSHADTGSQPAPYQLQAFQNQLARLESSHLANMDYWGIEI